MKNTKYLAMTKYKWLIVLAVIYTAFVGLSAQQYKADSALASHGKYVRGADRSSNPFELTFAAMDGKATWEKLTSRIDAKEAKKALPAGPLNFWMWFKDYISIYGFGFMPFTCALLATWFMVVISGFRIYQLFRPSANA